MSKWLGMPIFCNFCRFPEFGTEPSAADVFNPRYFTLARFHGRRPMGQAKPLRAIALIVEDDAIQRDMISMLLEESEYEVILCETAEEALLVLDRKGRKLSFLMTDVNLAGRMSGAELAAIAHQRHP